MLVPSDTACAAICDIAKAAKRLDKKCGMLKVIVYPVHSFLFPLINSVLQERLESTASAAEQLAKVLSLWRAFVSI